MSTLPIIDVSALRSRNQSSIQQLAQAIGDAASKTGFFYIEGHQIAPSVISDAYTAAQSFFALPQAEKLRYYIGNSKNHRGYVPFTERGDYADETHRNYEAFDLALDLPPDDPDFLRGILLLGPNQWPALAEFQAAISTYYDSVASLGQQICHLLERYLCLPTGAITHHMTKPISQLRLIHYVKPAQSTARKTVNMGAHTDYECLTLLHQQQAGLQVMTRDNVWHDVPVRPDAFVVNIGDMLEAWTNGILRSTPHRVLNKTAERYSMPYFVAADYFTRIAPFESLTSTDNPAKYTPFQAGAHLEQMLLRDFPYLRQRHATAPDSTFVVPENPFENRINPQ